MSESKMFRTHEDNLAGVPGMFGQGLSNWHMIQRPSAIPWYHVTLEQRDAGRTSSLVLMPSDEQMLQEILLQQGPDISVTEIQAVTPGWMNKSGGWKMERLTKLSTGYDKNEVLVCVLEVASGSMYTDVHGAVCGIESLTRTRQIYDHGASLKAP